MLSESRLQLLSGARHATGWAPELRDDGGRLPNIYGVAAVFYDGRAGTEYDLGPLLGEPRGKFVERIMPTAFDHVLRSGEDVLALFDHRRDQLLGRRSARTLILEKRADGLHYTIRTVRTTAGMDAVENARAGNLAGSSFSFGLEKGGEKWRRDGELRIREIHRVEKLWDVAPVTDPAYKATTVVARGHYPLLAKSQAGHNARSKRIRARMLELNSKR